MKIEITEKEKEALLLAIAFFESHDYVIYNCEKDIDSLKAKVVQPERLSEEAKDNMINDDSHPDYH